MTVRAWFTISALVMAALAAALAFQFLRPAQPPPIVVHAGATRLDGGLAASCWPRRTGAVDCRRSSDVQAESRAIPPEGRLRIVFAYPATPKTGFIRVQDAQGKTVLRRDWRRTIDYDLAPGSYRLTAQAGSSSADEAYVRYIFRFMVTRSGS